MKPNTMFFLTQRFLFSMLLFCMSSLKATTVLMDPFGDATLASAQTNPPPVDVLEVVAFYTASKVDFTVYFPSGTLNHDDFYFILYLDTNETSESRTGYPNGTDYRAYYLPWFFSDVQVEPLPGLGLPGGGTVPIQFPTADSIHIEIPLTMLGNDDGAMRFGIEVGKRYLTEDLPNNTTSIRQDQCPDDLTTLTEITTSVTGYVLPDSLIEAVASGGFKTNNVFSTIPPDPQIGPSLILNPDLNDMVRQRIADPMVLVTADAKASLAAGLGASSYVSFPFAQSGLWSSEQAQGIGRHVRRFTTMASPGTTDFVLDLLVNLHGSLGLQGPGAGQIPSYPAPPNLYSEVRLSVIMHSVDTGPVPVFSVSGRFFTHENEGGPLELALWGTPLWMSAWSTSDTDPDPFGFGRSVNYLEILTNVATFPVGQEMAIEFRLESKAYADKFAANWVATADFLNTATIELTTDTPGVTITEIVPPNTLRILDVHLDESQILLTWESFPGKTYTIQGSSDLDSWSNLQTGIAAAGDPNNQTTATAEPISDNGPRFYQVIEE